MDTWPTANCQPPRPQTPRTKWPRPVPSSSAMGTQPIHPRSTHPLSTHCSFAADSPMQQPPNSAASPFELGAAGSRPVNPMPALSDSWQSSPVMFPGMAGTAGRFTTVCCFRRVIHATELPPASSSRFLSIVNPGRMWGHLGDWPRDEAMVFKTSDEAFHRFRRMCRGWRKADARKPAKPRGDLVGRMIEERGRCRRRS